MAADPATRSQQVTASIVIEARPEEIYGYFTCAEAMVTWMGQYARLDPRPGGEVAVDINGSAVRGRYRELDPPRRLVFSWGFAGSNELPPGSSTVEVVLAEEAGGTRVTVTHTGLPEPERARHGRGWQRYLARLADAAS